MIAKEIWKPIKGHEGIYEISNFGRVKSLQKRIGGRRKPITVYRELIMSPTDNGNGYLIVRLSGEKPKNHYVHRLVAEAFCDNPECERYVNHIDFDTKNNNADNLEWCSQKENVRHSVYKMRRPRDKSKPTNTGEKYIHLNKHGTFCVNIRRLNKRCTFKTLDEAVLYRNEVIKNG